MFFKSQKSFIFLTVIVMELLTGMEFDLFVPSFPELRQVFHLSPFWVETILSANFVGYCVSLFCVGGLGDRYGRKPIILIGLVTFICGSLLCLMENSFVFLLLGRFLQGVGIAAPSVLSFLIIADTYPMQEQRFFLAVMNGAINISISAAPVIGSYIALYFHWRGNFMVLLVLSIFALIMVLAFVPLNKLQPPSKNEARYSYFKLLRFKPLMLLIINLIFLYSPYWIFVGMSPLLYMESLKVSLSQFGFYQGALAFVFAVGSIAYGFLLNKFNHKKSMQVTYYILIVSLLILSWATYTNSANPLILTLAFIPFVIGQIIPTIILYPLCVNLIPQAKGRATALLQALRLILTSIALQIAGYFYVGSFQNIGIILISCMVVVVITFAYIIKNPEMNQQF